MTTHSLLLSVLMALLFTSCISRRIAERDIFYPVKVARLADTLRLEEVTILADDSVHLNAWFIKHPNARGTLLYCGGNGFSLHHPLTYDVINMLTGFQMNLLLFDYRGYGRSEGISTLAGIRKDGYAALLFSHLSVPLLVLAGENDALTPAEMGSRLYESAGSKHKRFDVIPRANHDDFFFTNDQRRKQFIRSVAEFFDFALQ